jgi:predicted RNase H-like nuclease (RuvC/YqgF family)
MAKAPKLDSQPQVVTANDLKSGDVVYLTDASDWSRRIAEAAVAANVEAGAALLAVAEVQAKANVVVTPYLIPVQVSGDAGVTPPRPIQYREIIRAEGPTTERRPQKDAA